MSPIATGNDLYRVNGGQTYQHYRGATPTEDYYDAPTATSAPVPTSSAPIPFAPAPQLPPAVVTSSKARTEVKDSQRYLQDELNRLAGQTQGGNTFSYQGKQYVQTPEGPKEAGTQAQTSTQTTQGTGTALTPATTTQTKPAAPTAAPEPKSDFQTFAEQLVQAQTDFEAQQQKDIAALDSIRTTLDAANASLIDSIKATYDNLIAEQKRVNEAQLQGVTQSGIRAGRQRYTPELAMSEVANQMSQGVQRVADLEGKRKALIAEAQLANSKEQYDMLYKKITEARATDDAKKKQLLELYQLSQETEKEAREQAKFQLDTMKTMSDLEQKTVEGLGHLINSSLSGNQDEDREFIMAISAQYGIDPNLLISQAEKVRADAKQYEGSVGEYKFYVDQTRSSGGKPVSYAEWKEQLRADSIQVIQDPLTGDYVRYNKTTGESTPLDLTTSTGESDLAGKILETIAIMETGGVPKPGKTGEMKSVLQWLPETWKKWSTLHAQTNATKPLPLTTGNEQIVGRFKVETLLNQGYSPEEIASTWNSGGPDPTGKKGVKQTANGPVEYDAEAYVDKFKKLFYGSTGTATTNTSRDEHLLPYAQQYASTGQIPTGLPKGSFARVAQLAKELPKQPGTVIDANTGIKPQDEKLVDAMAAMYDITKKIDEAKPLFDKIKAGVVAGTFGKIFGAEDQERYMALRNEITDLLARARTGAAITEYEQREYAKKLPGRFNQPFFLGPNGSLKLETLSTAISGTLNTKLKAQGWKIVGYGEADPSKYDQP